MASAGHPDASCCFLDKTLMFRLPTAAERRPSPRCGRRNRRGPAAFDASPARSFNPAPSRGFAPGMELFPFGRSPCRQARSEPRTRGRGSLTGPCLRIDPAARLVAAPADIDGIGPRAPGSPAASGRIAKNLRIFSLRTPVRTLVATKAKTRILRSASLLGLRGGPSAARTPDPLIKSQLLYQLS